MFSSPFLKDFHWYDAKDTTIYWEAVCANLKQVHLNFYFTIVCSFSAFRSSLKRRPEEYNIRTFYKDKMRGNVKASSIFFLVFHFSKENLLFNPDAIKEGDVIIYDIKLVTKMSLHK